MKRLPIIDMHCDLMVYMLMHPDANPERKDFGASFPFLREGNVQLQVMAMYTTVEPASSQHGPAQSEIYKQMLVDYAPEFYQAEPGFTTNRKPGIATVAAIESASGLCNETEPLDNAFKNLDHILENVSRLFYISFTHHLENRFGGGNYAEAGLKSDGKALLEYMAGKQIAIDLSHTSDALAHDILDYTYQKGLDIPVIASHSNFREVWDHPRNLTLDNVKEVINRKGLIGMNFLRAFVNNDHAGALLDHTIYGMDTPGGEDCLCFGADFFYLDDHPDKTRIPFLFPAHENASKYQGILEALGERLSATQKEKLAHKNIERFINENWS